MENIKERLLSIIRNHIDEDNNLRDRLIDVLDINGESFYRRLRGDVNFSFKEIAILAKELGFSVDNIIGVKKQNEAQFKLFSPYTHSIENIMEKAIEAKFSVFKNMDKLEVASLKMATNSMPLALYSRCQYLSKFFLYKWKYQTQKNWTDYSFSEYTVPQSTLEYFKRYAYRTFERKPPLTLIIDEKMYTSLISDIVFFYRRNLIDAETLRLIKEDLLSTLDILESFSIKGITPGGGIVNIYISSIAIDRTYIYIGNEKYCYSEFAVYSIIPLISTDSLVCRIQEEWIESLKKYSTLITQCNEIERYNYFSSQREVINDLIG